MSKKVTRDEVYIVYIPNQGWYTGDEPSFDVDQAWSTPDRGVADSYAALHNGQVYARHFEYHVGPVKHDSRFA